MDVAADAISRYASAGGRAVDFTSTMGEPTLCPHLPAIVRSAVAAGMRERSMVTNGILLGRDDDAADLLDSGLTQVTVSTADFDREVYALVMGVDRFSDLCEGLDALLRANARRRWPARISVCVRNALPPSVTLRSPAWRAIVEPHRRRIAVHFTIAFDSWCGSLRESDFLGRMRMRPALPWTDTPCIGLFQPVVLHDGQVRLCPCRSHGSEYDGLVVGTLDDYADRALNIARGFYRGARPPPCRTCSFYQPITLRWLRARRARLTAAPSA